jgi:KDO2-lipid IV(A) lauroyltransferase
MGSFEMAAQAYAERFGARQPVTVLFRPARQAWLAALQATARGRPGLATAPADLSGVRLLLRALKRGETVGLLPDQVPPQGQGVWAPFFGRPAYTMTLAARLVQQTGAALGLLWCERLPHGAGYVVHVLDMAEALPAGGDDAAAAASVNRAMEAVIARAPQQYLWGYHRYKQPRGGAPA